MITFHLFLCLKTMVELKGFEPLTPCLQSVLYCIWRLDPTFKWVPYAPYGVHSGFDSLPLQPATKS